MLTLLRYLSWTYISHRPLKALLTILGMACGIAVFVAIDISNQSVLFSLQNSIQRISGTADLSVLSHTRNVTTDDYKHLLDSSEVYAVTPIIELSGFCRAEPGTEKKLAREEGVSKKQDNQRAEQSQNFPLQILGVDPVSRSQFFQMGSANSAAEPAFAKLFDEAQIVIVPKNIREQCPQEFSAAGFRLQAQGKSVLLPYAEYDPVQSWTASELIVYMDIATVQESFGVGLSQIDLKLQHAGPDSAQRIRALLPPGVSVQSPAQRLAAGQNLLKAFQHNLLSMGLVSIFVAVFIVYNASNLSILFRREQFAILRALGASRSKIVFIFLCEILFSAVLSAALGILLGWLAAALIFSQIVETVQQNYLSSVIAQLFFDKSIVLKSLGLSLGASFLGMLLPTLELVAIAPAQAARRLSYESHIRKHHWLIIVMALLCFIAAGWAYLQISLQSPYWAFLVVFTVLLGLLFFTPFLMQAFLHPLKWLLQRLRFVTGFFSSTQILENPYRYSIVTAALALAIALWIGIGMMVNSFRSSLEEWIYATVPGNVYVELTKNADEYRDAMGIEVLHKIEQLPALEWVDSLQRLRLSWKDQDVTFSIIHLSGMMQRGNLQVLAGDRDFFRPDAVTAGSQKTRKEIRVAVSESYARRHGWNIGELYYLNSPWGRLPLRLGAILYDYTSEQGLIYAEKEDAKSFIPPEKFHAFALFLKEDFLKDAANVKSLIQDLRKWPEFSNKVRVRSQKELIDHAFEIFDQTFQVTEALRVVALFVAFLGVLTTLAILIEEKRRDIGLLQSLGMSPRQVVLYGLLQGLMIAILAFAIGAISGVVLCWLIINLVHYYFFGWTIFFFLDFGLLGQSLLLTLAAGAIASTAGMYYLKKLKLSEALRFDE